HWECFLERVHPQDLPRVREAFAQPTPQRPEHEFEHRIVLPGGQVRWLLQRGRTEFDPECRPVRTSGFAQDITESKRNEKLERDKAMDKDAEAELQAAIVAFKKTFA
ncbi:PAS domain-containing protein, partial [Escherichia coli]|nr:PAS domain-containing protein [Escherichia coli]